MTTSVDSIYADLRTGRFEYMESSVTPSLHRNGRVYTRRDVNGSDDGSTGVDLVPVQLPVHNARNLGKADTKNLRQNGFELVDEPFGGGTMDFMDNERVVSEYYPHCADVVRTITGATVVAAFDHNVRSATGKTDKQRIAGGQQVQGPAHIVHGDYTLTSAPERLRKLAQAPLTNDTWRQGGATESLLDPDQVEQAISGGRYGICNVWRNIAATPVARNPMALCDSRTVSPEDLVVFEIHYTDRIGENYFARHSTQHQWYCYPQMTPDEALLITQWDSDGELAQTNGARADAAGTNSDSPCTFSFHTAFEDPTTQDDAPDRWSIEVRCAVLYI